MKYTKQLDDGTLKRVTEPYLLSAMTFTDAEARIYEELGQTIRGEFNVTGISKTEIHDIFHYEDADVWYKVKIRYESVDSEESKGKKVSQNFLVSAHTVKDAYERIQESLSTLMADFEIPTIAVSPIVDIFPFQEELDKEISRTPIAEVIEEEEEPKSTTAVFSASGSAEEDEEEMAEAADSEITDEFED